LKNSRLCFPELFSWLLAHINGDSQPGFTTTTHNQTNMDPLRTTAQENLEQFFDISIDGWINCPLNAK
jgi:hypothetical protein